MHFKRRFTRKSGLGDEYQRLGGSAERRVFRRTGAGHSSCPRDDVPVTHGLTSKQSCDSVGRLDEAVVSTNGVMPGSCLPRLERVRACPPWDARVVARSGSSLGVGLQAPSVDQGWSSPCQGLVQEWRSLSGPEKIEVIALCAAIAVVVWVLSVLPAHTAFGG